MEFLKDHISDELYSLLAIELKGNHEVKLANLADGQYVSVDKYNSLYRKSKIYRDRVRELDKALEGLDGRKRKEGIAELKEVHKDKTELLSNLILLLLLK